MALVVHVPFVLDASSYGRGDVVPPAHEQAVLDHPMFSRHVTRADIDTSAPVPPTAPASVVLRALPEAS